MFHFSHIRYIMQKTFLRWQSDPKTSASVSVLCFVILLLLPLSMNTVRIQQETQSAALAPHILRFHIMANSDKPEDQSLKLEVRDLLLKTIQQDLCESTSAISEKTEAAALTKEQLTTYISSHSETLKASAEQYMNQKGFPYSAEIRLETHYFPTGEYNGITCPCGIYDSVCVFLGEGKGHNWWCILYPSFSCPGGITSSAPSPADTGQEALTALIPADDYGWMNQKRTLVFGNQTGHSASDHTAAKKDDSSSVTVQVRLKSFEWLSSLLE